MHETFTEKSVHLVSGIGGITVPELDQEIQQASRVGIGNGILLSNAEAIDTNDLVEAAINDLLLICRQLLQSFSNSPTHCS